MAGVVPEPSYYPGVTTIRPSAWSAGNGPYFSISFSLNKLSGPGIYTVSIWAKNTIPYKHPYDSGTYYDSFPIMEYAVYIP
jgi:hypothetical protein